MAEIDQMTHIFLRDDDVGALGLRLRVFMDVFASRGLPVSYQVIPKQLTEDCAALLKERRQAAPNLFEFSQHGLTHEMIVGGKKVYYEYGPERSYDDQLASIRSGQEILSDRLGSHFNSSVFTPPQHKYDRNTLRALRACDVKLLSASNYTRPAHRAVYAAGRALGLSSIGRSGISYHGGVRPDSGLFELSIAVAVDDGSDRQGSPTTIVQAVEQARRHTQIVGLMFHHNAYDPSQGAAFLTELADRLLEIPEAQFHLLSGLHDHLTRSRAAT